jgi:hypothetical protein
MKRIAAIVTLALGCVPVLAQTAKVVQLSPQDAIKAKQLYDAQVAAEKAYTDFRIDIGNRYVSHEVTSPATACAVIVTPGQSIDFSASCTPPKPTPDQEAASHSFQFNQGWWEGFDFSEDFKFIVPKDYPKYPTTSGGMGCSYVTPALMNGNVSW